jgi:protein required for attachment to host cells
MAKLRIAAGDWIVVCDGAKALILENAGDAVFPNLKTREVHAQPAAHAPGERDDTAGARQGLGQPRAGIDPKTGQDQSEHTFLQALAGRLDAALGAGEAKSLVIVAPPRALGMLRDAYSPALRSALRGEIDKDYVRMPVHEIEKHLAQAVPV